MEGSSPQEHAVDGVRIERAVGEILLAIGEDTDREGLRETPARVARAHELLFARLGEDPARHLNMGFQEGHHELVLVRDIPIASVYEHQRGGLRPLRGSLRAGRSLARAKEGRRLPVALALRVARRAG